MFRLDDQEADAFMHSLIRDSAVGPQNADDVVSLILEYTGPPRDWLPDESFHLLPSETRVWVDTWDYTTHGGQAACGPALVEYCGQEDDTAVSYICCENRILLALLISVYVVFLAVPAFLVNTQDDEDSLREDLYADEVLNVTQILLGIALPTLCIIFCTMRGRSSIELDSTKAVGELARYNPAFGLPEDGDCPGPFDFAACCRRTRTETDELHIEQLAIVVSDRDPIGAPGASAGARQHPMRGVTPASRKHWAGYSFEDEEAGCCGLGRLMPRCVEYVQTSCCFRMVPNTYIVQYEPEPLVSPRIPPPDLLSLVVEGPPSALRRSSSSSSVSEVMLTIPENPKTPSASRPGPKVTFHVEKQEDERPAHHAALAAARQLQIASSPEQDRVVRRRWRVTSAFPCQMLLRTLPLFAILVWVGVAGCLDCSDAGDDWVRGLALGIAVVLLVGIIVLQMVRSRRQKRHVANLSGVLRRMRRHGTVSYPVGGRHAAPILTPAVSLRRPPGGAAHPSVEHMSFQQPGAARNSGPAGNAAAGEVELGARVGEP